MSTDRDKPTSPRLVPEWSLPAYSYVPGKFTHPKRHPEGGIPKEAEAEAAHLGSDIDWSRCRPYRYGFDLFNAGYYWEAHEAWEAVWHGVGRRGAMADCLKGLIAFAASGVKAREGRAEGVAKHGSRARKIFEALQGEETPTPTRMGLSLKTLIAHAESLEKAPDTMVNPVDDSVVRVMPFELDVDW